MAERRLSGMLAALLSVALLAVLTLQPAHGTKRDRDPAKPRIDRKCGLASRGEVVADPRGADALPTAWDDGTWVRPRGTVRATMLFVDFADAGGETLPTRPLRSSLAGEAARWLDEVSYGRARLLIGARHGWLRMPKPSTAYWPPGGAFRPNEYIRDALAVADPVFDFSKTEIVYLMPAPGSEVVLSLAHTAPRVRADGVGLGRFATFGQDVYRDVAARRPARLLQATSHLFSLPYLNDPAQAGAAGQRWAGSWDPMGEPALLSHPNAWSKRKLGWLKSGRSMVCLRRGVVAAELVALSRRRGLRAITVKLNPRRRYVIEARRRRGFDGELCAEGVVVWLIDGRFGSGEGPMRVQPARSDSHNPARACRDAGASGALDRAPLLPGRAFKDAEEGVTVKVKRSTRRGYFVRVRKS